MKDSTIILSVDFGRNIESMIVAGKYECEHIDDILTMPAVQGWGVKEFEFDLFPSDSRISSEELVRRMVNEDKDPTRPWEAANIKHLLVFGAAFPDLLLQAQKIVALGSVAEVGGSGPVPYLSGYSLYLSTYSEEGSWGDQCHLLRVRSANP